MNSYDPHIAPLLKMIMTFAPDKGPEHFILVPENDHKRTEDWLPDRITPVTYGESYQQLPRFLEELAKHKLGKVDKATGSQATLPFGSNTISLESSKRGELPVELPLDTVQQIYKVIGVLRWDIGKQAYRPAVR